MTTRIRSKAASAIATLRKAVKDTITNNAFKLKGLTLTASYQNTYALVIAIAKNTTFTEVSETTGATTTAIDITTSDTAKASITAVDAAIKALNNQHASLDSISNCMDSTDSDLTNISSNLQAGNGRIEDADFAAATTSLAKSQILQQASAAMLAQANASKQNVLNLL